MAAGREFNGSMKWEDLVSALPADTADEWGVRDCYPLEGRLSLDLIRTLVAVLSRFTSIDSHVTYCVWAGWPDIDTRYSQDNWSQLSSDRDFFLLSGTLKDAETNLSGHLVGDGNENWERLSPNLWWPTDRSWFVWTEVDSESTYIGASSDCVRTLLEVAAADGQAVVAVHEQEVPGLE